MAAEAGAGGRAGGRGRGARWAAGGALLLAGGAFLPGMAAAMDPPAEVEVGGLFALEWPGPREYASHFRLAVDM